MRERPESIALKGPFETLNVSNGPFRAWLAGPKAPFVTRVLRVSALRGRCAPEGSQVLRVAALVVGAGVDVVVAGQHAVGHLGRDDTVGRAHLGRRAVLGDVAQVGHEHHAGLRQVPQRLPYRLVVRTALVEQVLRVRQHRYGEALGAGVGGLRRETSSTGDSLRTPAGEPVTPGRTVIVGQPNSKG